MQTQKDFFWGALVGGAVATLVSLLFTTKKGHKIQEQLSDLYEEAEGKVKETFAHAKGKVEDVAETVGKKIASKAEEARK